jgi:hypothetical protein
MIVRDGIIVWRALLTDGPALLYFSALSVLAELVNHYWQVRT